MATLADKATGQINPSMFAHIEQLQFVFYNAKEYSDPVWRVVHSFSVPEPSIERFRVVVKEKSQKQSGYQHCDKYWLLVVVDLMDSAQDQHFDWPEGEVLTPSPFEKVLIFKPQEMRLLEAPQ